MPQSSSCIQWHLQVSRLWRGALIGCPQEKHPRRKPWQEHQSIRTSRIGASGNPRKKTIQVLNSRSKSPRRMRWKWTLNSPISSADALRNPEDRLRSDPSPLPNRSKAGTMSQHKAVCNGKPVSKRPKKVNRSRRLCCLSSVIRSWRSPSLQVVRCLHDRGTETLSIPTRNYPQNVQDIAKTKKTSSWAHG